MSVVGEPAVIVEGRAVEVIADVLAGRYPGTARLDRVLAFAGVDDADREAAMEALRDFSAARLRRRFPHRFLDETGGNGGGVDSDSMVVLTSSEVARMLGKSPRRVSQLAAAGALPAVRSDRGWRFRRDHVVEYARERGAA